MGDTPENRGATDHPTARLNPFAFPSETGFRFVLLIVAVLGSSLLLWGTIYEALPATRNYKESEYARCALQADPSDTSGTYFDRTQRLLLNNECTATADRQEAVWMLVGSLVVLGVGVLIYWTAPLRRVRQSRLVGIDDSVPEITACLDETRRATDLAIHPVYMWNPLDAAATGLAFGRWGRYCIALTGGLITQIYTDLPAFRAVVLHELAHVRNADIDRTYFSNALWYAFILAGVLPFAATRVVSGRAPAETLDLSWRILPLVILVYVTRNSVLRAREIYADVRASTWEGPSGALRRTLAALPRLPHRWSALWQLHPDPGLRRRALDDTRPLFRIDFWVAFGAGLTAGITLSNMVILLGLLVPMPIAIVRPLGAALVCAPLAAGVIGASVWRATFAAIADGQRPRGVGRAGIAMAAGLILGQEIAFGGADISRGFGPIGGGSPVMFDLVWGALLSAVLFTFFRWVGASASAWLEVTVDDASPGNTYRTGLTIAGALLGAWLGLLFFVYLGIRTGGNTFTWDDLQSAASGDLAVSAGSQAWAPESLEQASTVILVALQVLVLVSLLVFTCYPLAAWVYRHRRAAPTVAGWAFLDSPQAVVHIPLLPPLQPGRSALVALCGSLVYCVVTGMAYGALSQPRTMLPNGFDDVAAWTQYGTLSLAVTLQAIVAVSVAAWVRRLAALHGLFAAFLAGSLMGCGTLGILAALGLLWEDASLGFLFVSSLVVLGACVAAPLAVIAAWIASRMRGLTHSSRAAG
jgi:Zn-dependent protease with chaperone function